MAKKPHKDTSKRQNELQEKKDDLQQKNRSICIYNEENDDKEAGEILSEFDKVLKKIIGIY